MKGEGRNVEYSKEIRNGIYVERTWKEHLAYETSEHAEKLEVIKVLQTWGQTFSPYQ